MFIKRSLRNSRNGNITRRVAISSIAASVAGAMVESSAQGQRVVPEFDQHKLVVATEATGLWMADVNGNQIGNSLGVVLACPQSCAAARPGYAEALTTPALNAIYLNTSEWMREIIYTPDLSSAAPDPVTWRKYRRQLGFYRVTNDTLTSGCGHISRNATVTQVTTKSGSGKFVASLLGEGYSSVAAKGATNSNGIYVATEVYIYQGNWAPLSAMTPNLNTVLKEIANGTRPIDVSACPAPSLPYPQ